MEIMGYIYRTEFIRAVIREMTGHWKKHHAVR